MAAVFTLLWDFLQAEVDLLVETAESLRDLLQAEVDLLVETVESNDVFFLRGLLQADMLPVVILDSDETGSATASSGSAS